jgi:hypothetical protein
MLWVLIIFLASVEQDHVYFNDLDTCLRYSEKVRSQNYHQRAAGDKIYLKAYCIPQNTEK